MEPTDAINEGSHLDTSLTSLSEKDWESADWPVVSFVPKALCDNSENIAFWGQVLNKKNFIIPGEENRYNPENDVLFILHSFKDEKGMECIFKAITTSVDFFVNDPKYAIDYRYHGQPCEARSRNIGGRAARYPTCNFWTDFYDNLSKDKQEEYPIPTEESRKRFILKNYFNK